MRFVQVTAAKLRYSNSVLLKLELLRALILKTFRHRVKRP